MAPRNLTGASQHVMTRQGALDYENATLPKTQNLTVLAKSTLNNINRIMEYWNRWCEMTERDPVETLRESPPIKIAGFFHWYCGAGHLTTQASLMTYWHSLNEQGNLSRGGARLNPDQLRQIKTILQGITSKEHHLVKVKVRKDIMEVEDLSLALQYYWTKDQAGPPTGRDRVQLATILLLIACTGSRPSAILSIKYSDITIYKYAGHDRLLMEVELTELKNKPEEESSFSFGMDTSVMFSVISHVIALAMNDCAFAYDVASSSELFDVQPVDGVGRFTHRFRTSIRNKYIFRSTNEPSMLRRQTYDTFNRYTQNLGAATGFPRRITAYCLRRAVGNAINDDPKASAATLRNVLNQKSQTVFESNYISKQIRYDVQGAFMKTPSKETLFRAAARLSSQIDPRRPTELSDEQVKQIEHSPAIRALFLARDREGDSARRQRLANRLKTEKRQAKDRLLRQVQIQYDEEAPIRDIERQRAGLAEIPVPVKAVKHEHYEQVRIADLVQVSQASSDQTTEFTDLLAALCKRRTKSRGLPIRRAAPPAGSQLSEGPTRPTKCEGRCLFCLWDPSLIKKQRERAYDGPGNIQRHVLRQHVKDYEEGELECPDPACGGVVLRTRDLLKGHMDSDHGVKLPEKRRQQRKLKARARK